MIETLNDLRSQPHWSYSAFNAYLNICSLQYYFRYVEQTEPERISACFAFGKAFHAALSHYARRNDTGIMEIFSEVLKVELENTPNVIFKEGENCDTLCELAAKMFEAVRREWTDTYNVMGVAVPFKVEVPGLSKPLIGEYDLLLEEGGAPVIVDWKTASAKWPRGKAGRDLQATVFSYAYHKGSGKTPLFRFDVITKTKNPSFESHYTTRTQEDFQRFELLANKVEAAVNKGVFLPNETSFACAECPYSNKCKNWR